MGRSSYGSEVDGEARSLGAGAGGGVGGAHDVARGQRTHAGTGVITRRGGVPCILAGGSGLRLDQACRDLDRLRLGRTLGLLQLLSALRVLGLPGLLGLCLLRLSLLSPVGRLDQLDRLD